jgi:restriction endonuclease Mrr
MSIRKITLLYDPIISILADGKEHSAWDIEVELARLFNVTEKERKILHPGSQTSVFRNDVAHAFSQLGKKSKIKHVDDRKAPDGGMRGIYRAPR